VRQGLLYGVGSKQKVQQILSFIAVVCLVQPIAIETSGVSNCSAVDFLDALGLSTSSGDI